MDKTTYLPLAKAVLRNAIALQQESAHDATDVALAFIAAAVAVCDLNNLSRENLMHCLSGAPPFKRSFLQELLSE